MSGNFISILKSIYEKSGIPVAVADSRFRIIWKNKTSGTVFTEGESLLDIFEGTIPDTGLVSAYMGDSLCSFNVLKAEDKTENELYYIAELVRSEGLVKIMNTPAIRNYISFICAKIKNAAGAVSNSMDEIYDSISCGLYDGEMITERLNIIDENIMSVAKEIVMPDQFYALMDMDEMDQITLSMESEIKRAVSSIESNIGKAVKITSSCERSIFFRMDRGTFETIIAGMTEQCCSAGLYPESLVYSVNRIGDDRAELSVMSVSPENRLNTVRSGEIIGAELRKIKNNLFFEYICDLLCTKFGMVFTKSEMPNGYLFKMEFDVITRGVPCIAMIPADYSIGRGRFGTIPLMLADFPVSERYKFYDIDAEYTIEHAEVHTEAEDESS